MDTNIISNTELKVYYHKNPLNCAPLPACGFVAQFVVAHNWCLGDWKASSLPLYKLRLTFVLIIQQR